MDMLKGQALCRVYFTPWGSQNQAAPAIQALTISTFPVLLATWNQPAPLCQMIAPQPASQRLNLLNKSSVPDCFSVKIYQKCHNHLNFPVRDARIAFCCSKQSVLSLPYISSCFFPRKECINVGALVPEFLLLISIIMFIAWRQNCKQ